MGSTRQSLEQERAKFALEKVTKRVPPGEASKYKTELRKLPARLHTNGLGQTVAFYLSSGKDKPEAKICGWLEEWLRDRVYKPEENGLIQWLTQDTEANYRRAAVEARALAVWLKRFAEAFLEDEKKTTQAEEPSK
jgi:CRISPR-associated protein Cmr5